MLLKQELGDAVDPGSPPVSDIKPSSVKLFYYLPREARSLSTVLKTPLYWFGAYNLSWSWVRIDRQSRLTPELIYGAIPEDAWWSPARATVLTGSFWPENFAHSLGDDFFPSESYFALASELVPHSAARVTSRN